MSAEEGDRLPRIGYKLFQDRLFCPFGRFIFGFRFGRSPATALEVLFLATVLTTVWLKAWDGPDEGELTSRGSTGAGKGVGWLSIWQTRAGAGLLDAMDVSEQADVIEVGLSG